jgi:hypothetical protein
VHGTHAGAAYSLQAGRFRALRSVLILGARLHPYGFRPDGNRIVDDGRHFFGAAEHLDHVDPLRDVA